MNSILKNVQSPKFLSSNNYEILVEAENEEDTRSVRDKGVSSLKEMAKIKLHRESKFQRDLKANQAINKIGME